MLIRLTRGKRLATRTDAHAGILLLVFKRLGRAVGSAFVEPESKAVRIRSSWFFEAGFVDESQVLPAIVAAVFKTSRRTSDRSHWDKTRQFQQIERAEAGGADVVPETIVAARPDDPRVAAFDFFRSEQNGAVHVVKVVFIGGDEAGRRAIRLSCFIEHGAGLWSFMSEEAIGDEGDDGNNQEKNDDAENFDFASSARGLLLYLYVRFGLLFPLGRNCRGGPLWPPVVIVQGTGGHRGPPLQLLLTEPHSFSAMHVKVFVAWIDRGSHLQVTIGLAVGTDRFVNDSGLVKQSRVFHA